MAEPILYKVEAPDGVEVPFSGIKPNIQNPDFDEGEFDRIVHFEDTTECLRDDKGNPAGIVQHPLVIWKEVNINTPFFKEVCHRRLLIPKVFFYFFHSLKGDTQLINFFTIEMEKALILCSKVKLFDVSEAHDPNKGVINKNKGRAYIEEVVFSAQLIRWKYKRDNDPCSADHGTEFKVP
jgi:type VI secretion system Hcp family effector